MTTPVPLPDKLPRWATTTVVDPVTNAPNIVEPIESKKNIGWSAFEPPARNYFNWLFNTIYNWFLYLQYRMGVCEIITDGNGAQIFSVQNSYCELTAVDKTAPTHYIKAIGWRGTTTVTLNVISSNTLTLGSPGSDGSQPISGGTASNIIVYGKCLNTTSA
jgi:hypothetical protein